MVKPCKPTPCNTLPFSPLDKFPPFKLCMVDSLLVFKHGQQPAKIIRQALSKALVPYFPVAGEFTVSDQGEISVSCTGKGVWFIEASASCTLNDLNFSDEDNMIYNKQEFLPHPPLSVDPTDMFIMFQVTEFKCGGFIVGLRFSHVMFDGVGVAQFMKAIGEIARGYKEPIIHPLWFRDQIIGKPNITLNFPLPSKPTTPLETYTIDFSLDNIKKLKNKFSEQTGSSKCSTFEVLVAKLWRSRLRAIKADTDVLVQLAYFVDLRKYFMHSTVLPQDGGYYGNCIYMKEVEAPCGKIVNGSFSEVVELIQDAKRGLSNEFHAWVNGEWKTKDMLMSYEKLAVNDWTKLGFEDVDYGWGEPQSVISVGEKEGFYYFVNSVLQKEGFYYGNCVYMKVVEAPSWKIVNGSFSEVVELIQDAKRGLSAELSEWVAGECRTKEMFMNYEMLMVNDWTKLGFSDVDFGWGAPLGEITVKNAPVFPICLLTTSPKLGRGGGVCLRTGCVKEEHLEEFLNQMNNFDSDDAC
ncbi:hypothetical protein J5N97_022026 [Dioscorea zingiberensis]|uniref:Uncharacterized protein n=1 Tax=Dioscorea zingiberensis TaxID=325984 RepID=A0A9D5CA06_9LILI|nr:hypothetical protein J5N97_022026 [Dioscorea zingiberensis]